MPWRHLSNGLATRRLLVGDRVFHLALLQLSFDASMQAHSSYRSTAEFVADCISAFARGVSASDLLVFKAHPFEDGRERLGKVVAREADRHGVSGRVLLLDGGASLTALLDGACSVITVNSTAGQKALWRGLPVAVLGKAVYGRPGLASDQDLAAFFVEPRPPSALHYRTFQRLLTETSQIRGTFYSRRGINGLLTRLPEALLAARDPYQSALRAVQPHPEPDNSPAEAAQESMNAPQLAAG
jgi:capsular polysaccharide export protein